MRAQMAGAAFIVASWRGQLLDLLFPARCVHCHRIGESLCPSCRSQIQLVTPPYCHRCGASLPQAQAPCIRCRVHPFQLDQNRAVAYHEGVLREAIHSFKYRRRAELAVPLAGLLQQHMQEWAPPVDVVTAVPLHPARQRQRGYNQAELLARALAVGISLPYVQGVHRLRATADQVGLDARTRRENVRGAFGAEGDVFRGRRVLLVDDVCTTGATLDECAGALKAQGAREVYGLTVARPK